MNPTAELLGSHSMVLCGGSGGVGKTTTAAALGVAGARLGKRTLVLTIDPARRLAQTMGIDALAGTPQPVAAVPNLHAMMLDAGSTFDRLVERFARTPEAAQRFLDNPYYQQIAATVAGAREFMAMAQVYELAGRAEWDLLVVDTPPTRHALDFLDAPRRLIELLDGTGLGMLVRATNLMNRMSFGMLARSRDQWARFFEALTGHRLMVDLNAFFEEFADIIDSFRARAARLQDMLRGEGSAFVLVLAPQPDLAASADAYLTRLRKERMQVPLAVFNQVHRIPACQNPTAVRAAAWTSGIAPDLVQRLFACHAHWHARARADDAVIRAWNDGVRPPALAIERYERGIGTLTELERFARDLCPEA